MQKTIIKFLLLLSWIFFRMPNLDIIYDVTIAVTWDEINTYKWVIYQPTCLRSFVTSMDSALVYGLELLVLEETGGKTLATDHRAY